MRHRESLCCVWSSLLFTKRTWDFKEEVETWCVTCQHLETWLDASQLFYHNHFTDLGSFLGKLRNKIWKFHVAYFEWIKNAVFNQCDILTSADGPYLITILPLVPPIRSTSMESVARILELLIRLSMALFTEKLIFLWSLVLLTWKGVFNISYEGIDGKTLSLGKIWVKSKSKRSWGRVMSPACMASPRLLVMSACAVVPESFRVATLLSVHPMVVTLPSLRRSVWTRWTNFPVLTSQILASPLL